MSTFSNQTKNSSSFSGQTKSSSTYGNPSKAIHPWTYNEIGFKYNQVLDSLGVYSISYNSIGNIATLFTNQTKN